MEDGSGRIKTCPGRVGVWYAFNDQADPTANQWPKLTEPGTPIETSEIPGGRGSSHRAIHATLSNWSYGAGIGLDLNFDGKTYGLYDGSQYDGITFWLRGTTSYEMVVRLNSAETTDSKYGGTAGDYWEGGSEEILMLRDGWRQHWVPFESLDVDRTAASQLTNLQFYCPFRCGSYDFWVDDISFYKGSPSCCNTPPPSCTGTVNLENSVFAKSVGKSTLTNCEVCDITSLRVVAPSNGTSTLDGLSCYSSLNELTIGNGQVADLTPIGDLVYLDTLTLSDTTLNHLDALSNLPQLNSLSISYTGLDSSEKLGKLSQLTQLDLSRNSLTEVDALQFSPHLKRLVLSNNKITDINGLAHLTELETLDLRNNQLVDLSPLKGLAHLQTLYLSTNQIIDLSPLSELASLETLDISYNQVVNLSPLSTCPKLRILGATNNQITSLKALLAAPGFNSVDPSSAAPTSIYIWANPLNCELEADNIAALKAKNVSMTSDCK
jgi:Leucine-rich repeat (LRR) protein